jgi:hypothetical protein
VPESAEVELDIFSGGPNPMWRLSDADAAALLRELEELPEAPPAAIADNLGYRGFVVHIRHDGGATRLVIQNGTVQAFRGDSSTYYRDSDRALEQWLLNSGRPFLDDSIATIVERNLN